MKPVAGAVFEAVVKPASVGGPEVVPERLAAAGYSGPPKPVDEPVAAKKRA